MYFLYSLEVVTFNKCWITLSIFFFTKLSGIDPCEKLNNIPGGHAWGTGTRFYFVPSHPMETLECSKMALGEVSVKNVWHKNKFYWMKISFLFGKKCLWLTQYVDKFLVWNISWPVKGQGIRKTRQKKI